VGEVGLARKHGMAGLTCRLDKVGSGEAVAALPMVPVGPALPRPSCSCLGLYRPLPAKRIHSRGVDTHQLPEQVVHSSVARWTPHIPQHTLAAGSPAVPLEADNPRSLPRLGWRMIRPAAVAYWRQLQNHMLGQRIGASVSMFRRRAVRLPVAGARMCYMRVDRRHTGPHPGSPREDIPVAEP
jgi:hypothetical protein